jgi:hypothetical protein
VQGLPVAIGEGRASARSSMAGSSEGSEGSGSSGGESPRSFERAYPEEPAPLGRQYRRGGGGRSYRSPNSPSAATMGDEYVCLCRRGSVRAYGRCDWCLRECGWNAYVS